MSFLHYDYLDFVHMVVQDTENAISLEILVLGRKMGWQFKKAY